MKQTYLITKNAQNFDRIYVLDSSSVELVEFGDFSSVDLSISSYPDLSIDFPYELYETIIVTTFLNVIQNRDFEYAFQLSLINKKITKVIYNSLLDHDLPRDIITTIRHIYKTLKLLETIDDSFITEFPQYHGKQYINIWTRQGTRSSAIELWDFLPYLTIDEYRPEITALTSSKIPKLFNVGPINGNQVWIRGSINDDGIFIGEELESPVFILNVLTTHAITMIGPGSHLKPFINLRNIFQFIYGEYATLYLMYNPDHNPFVSSSDYLIKV